MQLGNTLNQPCLIYLEWDLGNNDRLNIFVLTLYLFDGSLRAKLNNSLASCIS